MDQETPDGSSTDDAFVALLTMNQEAVHSYLCALMPGDSRMDDVLQRTNMVLWRKRESFEEGSNFKAWAFAVARWELKAWLTENKRQDWLVFDDDLVAGIESGFLELPNQKDGGMVSALRLCLAKLNDKQRFLVLNYYQHEKSIGECSKILERSEGSLRVTLFRIRSVLRKCIELQLNHGGYQP